MSSVRNSQSARSNTHVINDNKMGNYHQDHITEGDVREFIRARGRCVLQAIGGSAYMFVRDEPPSIENQKEAAYV
jgi:hypothetical protein